MVPIIKETSLYEHCHTNTNDEFDRFVGIIVESNDYSIHFPAGYEISKDENTLRKDIRNLISVLTNFTEKKERTIHSKEEDISRSVEFPIQAYMSVIGYFLDNNGKYYFEKENDYILNGKGKTNWGKTIKKIKPIIQDESPIYLDTIKKVVSNNEERLITKIHKYCVYESYQQIGWLFTMNQPDIPEIAFNKSLFLSTLYKKMSNTNKTNDKILFQSMISMIEFVDQNTLNKSLYFGTSKFEHVWEKMIDRMFGIKNKDDYLPHAKWTERYGPNNDSSSSALEPDSIMLYKGNIFVLDAKYYRYGIGQSFNVGYLPASSDINKQITYGQYVKKQNPTTEVYNAFIMPFNSTSNKFGCKDKMLNVCEAKGDWITDSKKWETIQGVVIDTNYVLHNYSGNHAIDRELLCIEIEKYYK